ncbi:hypothetical protein TNCV_973531 [Trichonephila clavipes]|nr:hypothetical protein TNCV_973531 [Trichonephila clavipes]
MALSDSLPQINLGVQGGTQEGSNIYTIKLKGIRSNKILQHKTFKNEKHVEAVIAQSGRKLPHEVTVIKHPMVFLAKFAPMVGPGHQHSLIDAVAFPSYARHALLERDLVIWLAKEVFDKLNGSKTVLRMLSTYRCAVNMPLMTTKVGPVVKRNGTPDHNSWLRAYVACNSESRIGTLPWASVFNDHLETVGSGICL